MSVECIEMIEVFVSNTIGRTLVVFELVAGFFPTSDGKGCFPGG
jgi:hypothetical protein